MSIEGNGQSVGIEDANRQLDLECIKGCESKIFRVIVVPLGIRPGAAITKMQCVKCRNVFVVSENGVVGDKSHLFQDHQNRNHHRIICEPGIYRKKE